MENMDTFIETKLLCIFGSSNRNIVLLHYSRTYSAHSRSKYGNFINY